MMDEAGRGSTRPTALLGNKRPKASSPSPLGDGPAISAVMFTAGVLGNLTALVLLLLARRRRLARRERLAPFHVLLMALVLTDLLGTCLLSPVVLAAYGRQQTLNALDRRVCDYFAFSMSFFSLATMSCLGAMALERSLAMAAPYLYERLLSGRPLALLLGALLALYGLVAAFCALPLMGFGSYMEYWPGTWCFIEMRRAGRADAFALLYASVLLLLILAVLLGNLVVMVSLCRMYLRRAHTCLPTSCRCPALGAPLRAGRQAESGGEYAQGARRPFSMSEELDHLILLFIMTIIFAVCSLPFTIHAFMNSFVEENHQEKKEDLLVMRFLSVNSIVNPWAFVILRPPILRLVRSILCCQIPLESQPKNRQNLSLAKPVPVEQMDNCRQ
ncbi:prostaglandin E2 receptor EP2 subtype isoform X1 [Crotalus tigris]|uniref:prostaglandin E2 receptor EP2 subtype isoform X1 n=1 Tax=Crotalus tigris TaxID=88082 RepID=UPI00192F8ABA|nr:prostaglandin E2 receptor EP2 subtype isoform X1 [Crotalus tigris]